MAFGDVNPTVAVLRCVLPGVCLAVGAPTCWKAQRSQPNTWLTRSTIALYSLVFATAVLGMVQLLVPAGSAWGGAKVEDVFNTAACVSLLLAAYCSWVLAACVIDATPWGSKSVIGKVYRYLTWSRDHTAPFLCIFVGAGLASSLAFAMWPVVDGTAPSPGFLLCIYLSIPGFTALFVALMLGSYGGLDPLGPSLSFAMGPLLVLVAAIIELTEPPLPDAFDADALAAILVLIAVLSSAYGVYKYTTKSRRRLSMMEGLLSGPPRKPSQSELDSQIESEKSVKGTAVRAELSAAFGKIRRASLADLLWLNPGSPKPTASSDPESEWEAAAKRQKFAATLLWFVVCFSSGLPGVALGRFVQFDLRAEPSVQEIFGVIGSVPWNFKFAAAFLSDTLPICGRRRIPYLVGGIIAQCSAYWLIGVSTGLDRAGDPWGWIVATNGGYAALNMMMAVGAMFTGVMCDTVVVETSMRYERVDEKGQIQTNTWMWGGIGGLIAGLFAGWMLEYWPNFTNRQMLRFVSLFRLSTLLVCFLLTVSD